MTSLTSQDIQSTTGASVESIKRTCDFATRIVDVTSATVTVDRKLHEGRVIRLNRAAGITITLPASTGNGEVYNFLVVNPVTSNAYVLDAATNGADLSGIMIMKASGSEALSGFVTAGGNNTMSLNGTTTGGSIPTYFTVISSANNFWAIDGFTNGSGTLATPFSTV